MSRILFRPYQLPLGPDAVDAKITADEIPAGAKTAVTALLDDNRYLYSKPGQSDIPAPPLPVIKKIKTATAYIDKLPWEPGAVGIPLTLSASDKASAGFEDATKTASGMLDTVRLAPGRHMVYVQGTTEHDKPGSVSAAFLSVKDAGSSQPTVVAGAPGQQPSATTEPGSAIMMPMGRRGGGALGWSDMLLVLLGLASLVGVHCRRR